MPGSLRYGIQEQLHAAIDISAARRREHTRGPMGGVNFFLAFRAEAAIVRNTYGKTPI